MLVAFIGCSCVGKSTIMNLLKETRGFQYARNIVTRYSRPGEYHKTTISEDDFKQILTTGKLALHNMHFGFQYAYLKEEIDLAIADPLGFSMIDFGIENIKQLDQFANTYKIILIPESEEILLKRVEKIRNERFIEVKNNYEVF